MKKLLLILGSSLSLLAFQLVDDTPLRTVSNQLLNYLRTYPSEKVYLHTDRDVYLAGDNLWLKAYLVDGLLHQADSASGTLYVQLANDEGAVLETRVLRAEYGYAHGDFQLNDSLPDGRYQLVAFTNWMRNSDPGFFFRKTIEIFNSRQEPEASSPAKPALDVQFFPEGGTLVTGVRSRVAFKAINQSGMGVQVEGSVATADGQEVAPLRSEHAGMGVFLLKPEKGKEYIATIRSKDGLTQRFTLPAARDSGAVLTIDNSIASNIKVSVMEPNSTQTLYLVGHVRGQVRFLADLPPNRSSYFYINRSLFPEEGIIHFTVFNQKLLPLSERLIFNTVRKPLTVEVSPDKPSYKPHEKVTLAVSVKDADNKPVAAELSLAATDAGLLPATNARNIYSYLLLSSDLKGHIENPDFYFNPENEKAAAYLDLLLMTQGWRRFVWEEVLRDVYAPPTHRLQAALPISGRLLLPGNKPAENLSFSLIAQTGTQQQFLNGQTEAGGKFAIPDGAVYNSTTQFQVKTRQKQDINVLLDPFTVPSSTQVPVRFPAPTLARSSLSAFMKNAENWQEILTLIKQEEQNTATTSTARAEEPAAPAKGRSSKNTAGKKSKSQSIDPRRNTYGSPDTSFPLDDNVRNGFSDVLQVLKGRVPGVTVSGENVLIRGVSTIMGSTEPLFLIDGVPSSKSAVLSLSVRDVEAIDVLKGPSASAFGTRGSNGVINVLTRRYEKDTPDTGSSTQNTIGYAIAREFYAPRYDVVKPGQFPDRRPTVYWAPVVRTGPDGKATVSYWNPGSPTTVQVQVQGAVPTGRFGTGTLKYDIR
ncbi:MG2 domain-containing protein [Telluribacter sp.]|jgi:hypothetical protein|uniref:MG2 domain-containing protein n=1 Tax=Telluribacter sp. TaxID=1978767 RepID=UPI002E0EA494|nr:MG2 domain-containing protein [Telluribacter sp.]